MDGAETFIMNVYRKIDREKIQFDFLCMNSQEGHYDKEILELGGRIFRIDSPAKVGYIKHIKQIVKIIKDKGPYKVVHSPTQFHSGIVCFAAYLGKVPIRISHSHSAGVKEKRIIRTIYNLFCRFLINIFSTNKIACGEKARNLLFGNSKKVKNEVFVLNNGIDIDKYINVNEEDINDLKRNFNITRNTCTIGHVGRFVKEKNHHFFIKLAKYYKENNIDVKIILVGDGPTRTDIESLVKKEGLQEYITFTGIRTDIPNLMNCFDIFVMPSFYEGFPVSIIEALASGKNCVISETISREVEIVDNTITFLSLSENIDIWANEIIEQAKIQPDKAYRKNVLIEKGFSIDNTVEFLTNIYLKGRTNEEE